MTVTHDPWIAKNYYYTLKDQAARSHPMNDKHLVREWRVIAVRLEQEGLGVTSSRWTAELEAFSAGPPTVGEYVTAGRKADIAAKQVEITMRGEGPNP